jgi:mRNA interferase RelE/StbE
VGEYQILFTRSASKELESLPQTASWRVVEAIELLAVEPRPSGVTKLQGPYDLWRIRVGDYRVIYSVGDRQKVIEIHRIRHRRDAYR